MMWWSIICLGSWMMRRGHCVSHEFIKMRCVSWLRRNNKGGKLPPGVTCYCVSFWGLEILTDSWKIGVTTFHFIIPDTKASRQSFARTETRDICSVKKSQQLSWLEEDVWGWRAQRVYHGQSRQEARVERRGLRGAGQHFQKWVATRFQMRRSNLCFSGHWGVGEQG